jgi:glycosyltransferase involved in cell wall biosynthesis
MHIGLLTSIGSTLDAFLLEIADDLRSRGHEVSLAAGTPTEEAFSTTLPGITRKPSLANLHAHRDLSDWVATNRIDVIVSSTATASALARLTIRKCPVIYFCHGLHWANNSGASGLGWKTIEKLLLHNTRGVITLNNDDESWFTHEAPQIPQLRLRYGVGVDTERYPRIDPPVSETTELIWIGELSERKNPLSAIQVASALKMLGCDFHLSIAGDGPLRDQTVAAIASSGLDDRVTYVGCTAAQPFMAQSHALMHTARWEGLPRVFLEALSTGRQIFSYDVKGTRDLPDVRLSPFANTEHMARAIAQWSTRRDSKEPLPELRDLSYMRAAEQIEKFIQSLGAGMTDARDSRALEPGLGGDHG